MRKEIDCKHERVQEISVEIPINLEVRKILCCVDCNKIIDTKYEYKVNTKN